MYTAFFVVDQSRGMSISTGRRHRPFFTFHVAIDLTSQRIPSSIFTNFNFCFGYQPESDRIHSWPLSLFFYHFQFIFLSLQSLDMPSGFPNFRQIPSNYEVVMANRRAALQSKTDATKDATKDAAEYDTQSIASSDTLVSKSKPTKSSQGFSSGWKRMWLLSQERVVSALRPLDWYAC